MPESTDPLILMRVPRALPRTPCPQDMIEQHGVPALDESGRPVLKDVGAWLKREPLPRHVGRFTPAAAHGLRACRICS